MNKGFLRLSFAMVLLAIWVPAAFSQIQRMDSVSSVASEPPRIGVRQTAFQLDIVAPPALPRMSPELALQTVVRRHQEQSFRLASYSDETVMKAELPDYKQRGEYELRRYYSAPNDLKFTPIRYSGDGFVKTNILVRLLQSEVDHVEKGQGADTAITDANYKFSNKAVDSLDGRMVYVFHVKPRKKRVGLFKGKIFVDPYRGDLVRAEGEMTKSPSLFIRKLEFVQDYANITGFSLPTHLHSVAKVRIIGRTIVDIFHRDYQARAVDPDQPGTTTMAGSGAARTPHSSGTQGSSN